MFQAIWTARKNEEQSEDQILRRLLKLPGAPKQPERDLTTTVGFHDPRYGVKLDPNFQIFRSYKGKEYRAVAIQGFWIMGDKGYPTLNELNAAIGVGPENAWKAWRFTDGKGRTRPLSDLRDQSKIVRRSGD